MAEEAQIGSLSESANTEVAAPVSSLADVVQKPDVLAEQPVVSKEEKILKQSEVNEIVKRAKHEAADKARRDMLAEMQRGPSFPSAPTQPVQSSYTQQQPANNDGNIQQIIADEVRRQTDLDRQRFINEQQEKVHVQIGKDFLDRVAAAKEKYPDFDKEVAEPLKITGLRIDVIDTLNSVDNTTDVLKEMADNPKKYTEFLSLYAWNPDMARKELHTLSASIKKNQEALAQQQPNKPLSQVKPSNTGTDNGSLSIRDYKKMPWLRG